ncbi:hypothetical protein [Embleya sp. NPDC005575]|uniref:hypothetical protein n=1 Tax=Embleya sp. NPDC005575 TaxID=3156892 RepID=UPI00339E78D9
MKHTILAFGSAAVLILAVSIGAGSASATPVQNSIAGEISGPALSDDVGWEIAPSS